MKKIHEGGFTPEEKELLLRNPYTRSVSDRVIKFTDEFNELFIKRHSQGIGPTMIFSDCGYDTTLLGERRITDYFYRLKRQYKYKNLDEAIHVTSTPTSDNKYSNMPPLVAIDAMQHEIKYLRQEVEFLKKIVSLVNTKKR